MQPIGLEILIAITGTVTGILALYQQSHTPGRMLGLSWLGKVSLILIVVAGTLTLRALFLKNIDVLKERERTLQVQTKLERASLTVEQLGRRLQIALQENSKLSANIEAMRQDLIALRTATAQGILVPEYIAASVVDQRWRNNQILLRLRFRRDPALNGVATGFQLQFTDLFEPGPLGSEEKAVSIALINVRPSDMSAPTFRLQWADLVSSRNLKELFGGRQPESTAAFAHGDTLIVPAAKATSVQYWICLDDIKFNWAQFLKRNPDAAIRITVQ